MLLALLFISNIFAVNNISIERNTLYSEILKSENSDSIYQTSVNDYFSKTLTIKDNHCKKVTAEGCELKGQYSMNELVSLIGDIHNIMMDTFYNGSQSAPVAKTFSEAVDGKHTPDSQHYAALIASALSLRSVDSMFFKTPTLTGVYFKDDKNKELFWCILTPLANAPAKSKAEYVKLFNKNKNPKINGKENLTENDIYFMDSYDFKYTFAKKTEPEDNVSSNQDTLEDLDYTQKLLAPKKTEPEATKEVAGTPENNSEKIVDLSAEIAKPSDPTIGADAISAYEGSVDLFDQDGRIYASNKLRDKIKYESITKLTQLKKCALDNGVKESRIILKYNIGTDGKVSQLSFDNVNNDKFKGCVEPITSSFGITKDLVSTNVKVLQIVKLN